MSEKPYKYVAEPDEKGFRMPEYIPEQSEYTSQDSESDNDTRQDQSPSATAPSAQQPTKPKYKAKVKTQALDITQPETPLPAHVSEDAWHVEANKDGLSLGATTLGLGVFSLIGFFVFEAYTTLSANISEHPIGTSVLGTLLVGFVSCLSFLSFREWRGYKQVNTAMNDAAILRELLATKGADTAFDKANRIVLQHGKRFSKGSYAAHCFARYQQQLQSDMNVKERLGLYEDTVLKPVQQKAHSVLSKESVTAGSLAFISPNNLIQTFAVVWISFRTIRRMARVYGLRPSTAGNWKLLKVLAQNIAAQGVFDLATDEVANQIGGSLSAKFMENSAEAIAAGALNARLGRALIKLLK